MDALNDGMMDNFVFRANESSAQIREQMSGPDISILSCWLWPGLDCGIKGFGLIMSNF